MKQSRIIYIISALLLICSCSNQGAYLERVSPEKVGIDSKRLKLADSAIMSSIDKRETPGAVLAIVKDNKLAYLKAYGNKSVIPDTTAMTTNTIFDLASVSKCVGTTLSIMKLVEDGKIRLTDPVTKYIPEFQSWRDSTTGEVTPIRISNLLSHSSGIIPYINVAEYIKKYGPGTPDSLIKHIATELPLKYKPTTGYTYSCLNFITLQNILQRITGETLAEYAQRNIFGTLGLKHTAYLPLEKDARQKSLSAVASDFLELVAPTEVQGDGKPLLGEVHDPTARIVNLGNSGNAGVFSNAEDMAVIAAAIINKGEINGHRILSPMTIETMITVPKEDDPSIERSLGWDNYTIGAGTKGDLFLTRPHSFVHTGYTGPSIMIDMDNKCAIILLTNRVHPEDKTSIGQLRGIVANIVASSMIN
jgi:CubicO group peptidase (beta-lactamase class C family)